MGKKSICAIRRKSRRNSSSGTPPLQVQVFAESKEENDSESLQGLDQETPEAQGMAKRIRGESSSLSAQCNIEETDYNLTLELLEYERSGFLTKVDHEEDDETLVQYGDRFGLATLNDYPRFFVLVPQHPHYGETSLDNVKTANAENYWDLLMPLVQRGLSAVRKNSKKEIGAVEYRIARFTDQGFDLRHLQAYINISRRLLEKHSSLEAELKKVKLEIGLEKEKIESVISSKPLLETIRSLEIERENCLKRIADIDLFLAKKQQLLDEEKSIREAHTTPTHDMLLKTKEGIERRIVEAISEINTIMPCGLDGLDLKEK